MGTVGISWLGDTFPPKQISMEVTMGKYQRKIIAWGVALGALGSALMGAATSSTLELDEVIAAALEESAYLEISETQLSIKEAELSEAKSHRLPEVGLDFGYSRSTNPTMVFSNLLGQQAFTADNFALDSLNQPQALSHWHQRLVMEQPLFAGGEIRHGIRAADAAFEGERARHERIRQVVIHQAMEAYSGAVVAQLRKTVTVKALEAANSNVALVDDLFQSGLVIQSDLLQAQVRRAEVEEMDIQADHDFALATVALNLVMGRGVQTPIHLPEAVTESRFTLEEDLAQITSTALRQRPDLHWAAFQEEAAASGIAMARAGYFPRVGFGAVYELNADEFLGSDGDNWSVMVGARWSLFNGGRTAARMKSAKAKAQQAAAQKRQLRDVVTLEVQRALGNLKTAGKRRQLTEATVRSAEKSHSIVADRYREGLSSLSELLGAETAVTEARLRGMAASRNYLLATASLQLTLGELSFH